MPSSRIQRATANSVVQRNGHTRQSIHTTHTLTTEADQSMLRVDYETNIHYCEKVRNALIWKPRRNHTIFPQKKMERVEFIITFLSKN